MDLVEADVEHQQVLPGNLCDVLGPFRVEVVQPDVQRVEVLPGRLLQSQTPSGLNAVFASVNALLLISRSDTSGSSKCRRVLHPAA
jgi:hypothetical protein